MPCICDIRNEKSIQAAVQEAVKKFGGIDILINNASAISPSGTLETPMKRFDLMMTVNARGTFATTQACLPYLKTGKNPHVLNLSPPLSMKPAWFRNHVAYTISKYGMSMCVLGMAEEFKSDNIAVNALWPRTGIATAAIEMLGGKEALKMCRKPEIMADAAYYIITQDSKSVTGNFFIDDEVLQQAGVTDFESYAYEPGHDFIPGAFIDEPVGINLPQSEASPATILDTINSLLTEGTVKPVGATFLFNIQGNNTGKFYLDLRKGAGFGGPGALPSGETADATLTLDTKDFYKLAKGESEIRKLYTAGKLKVQGSMGMVLKLQPFFAQLKSKL